jgi:hypothetical protein
VLDEPVYLKDEEGAIEDNVNLLPVVVLEILSTGPGLVYRHYRIEISANNGETMGFVDIWDDKDMKLVIGKEKYKELLKPDHDDRDLQAIFSYIIQERISINLMSYERNQKEGGRRKGMAVGEDVAGTDAGAIVTIIRDNPDDFPIEEVESDSETEDNDTVPQKKVWLRLHSCRHIMSGRMFSTLVLFEGYNEYLFSKTNYYFHTASPQQRFSELEVVFKSFDTRSKQTTILRIPGSAVYNWLPKDVKIDFCHKVRRDKFGVYLIENLRLKYTISGGYNLELFNLSKDLLHECVV